MNFDHMNRARDRRVAADVERRMGGLRWVLYIGPVAAFLYVAAALMRLW